MENDVKISKIETNSFFLLEIIKILKERKKTIAIAESLTAGLVTARIANISGVSEILKGGIIAYDLKVKEEILKIKKDIIKEDAVNKETAQEMAKSIALMLNSDYGMSTTGIAEKYDERNQQAYMSIYDKRNDKSFNIYIEYDGEIDRNICRMDVVDILIYNLYMYLDT
jgi:nicotinamide-nucleotide amidase